jgi:peptidyl-prolyl cis-trans isomerase C
MSPRHHLLAAALACAALPAAAADPDDIVVRRGDAAVSFAEVDARIAEIPEKDRAGFMVPERIDSTLGQLLLLEQLANEARAAGIDKDPMFLAQRDLVEKRMLATLWQQRLREQAPGIDAAALAREAYLAAPERFVADATLDLRHILFKTDCRSKAAARELAEAARRRLVAGEVSFEDLAREASEDTGTSSKGGLMSHIKRGDTVAPFEAAAFALAKPGDLSPVVETEYGFHVIQLVRRDGGGKQRYEDIKTQLEADLVAQQRERHARAHSDRLLNLPIEANEAAVQSLRTRYADGRIPLAGDR